MNVNNFFEKAHICNYIYCYYIILIYLNRKKGIYMLTPKLGKIKCKKN